MEEKDFDRLKQIVTDIVGSQLLKQRETTNEDFKHHVGILTENFHHKLQIVAEGHQMLSEKLDRVKTDLDDQIGRIENKVDVVAADIAAHRTDTEGHKKGYLVRESGE